ncbi:MAG: hypothetical protein ABI615_12790 [Chthoniobacterales bacterium]
MAAHIEQHKPHLPSATRHFARRSAVLLFSILILFAGTCLAQDVFQETPQLRTPRQELLRPRPARGNPFNPPSAKGTLKSEASGDSNLYKGDENFDPVGMSFGRFFMWACMFIICVLLVVLAVANIFSYLSVGGEKKSNPARW